MKTRYIIPVDLNSIIYRNAVLLAQYNQRMGNDSKVAYYQKRAAEWKKAITAVLWHDEVGAWLDYDIMNDIKRDYFYPTNILPLWTDCYDIAKREEYVSKVLKYLEKNKIMLNLGGIPTTLEHSGEQWDYPNAWPPLQYFVIMALNKTEDPWAQRLAYEISERWVRSNYKAYNETHNMFEKVIFIDDDYTDGCNPDTLPRCRSPTRLRSIVFSPVRRDRLGRARGRWRVRGPARFRLEQRGHLGLAEQVRGQIDGRGSFRGDLPFQLDPSTGRRLDRRPSDDRYSRPRHILGRRIYRVR